MPAADKADNSSEGAEAKLASGSITHHLVAQTAPMLFGIAAIMSVGIIDAYFIGQLGAAQLAAVSFIFPVTIALSSLGVGVIAGINSVVSRALGAGDLDRARQLGNVGMAAAALFGILVALLLFLLRMPLFRLMQADDNLLPLIDAYMVPYIIGFPLLLTMMGGNGVLRGQGLARRASAILLGYAAANWVLDPLMINGAFGWEGLGIAGAAWATIGGWLLGVVVAFAFVQRSKIRFNPAHLGCDWRGPLASLLKVAGPASLSNAINPIGLAILTAFLARFGQDAVAGYGAAGRIQSFAVVPMLALSSSIGAIVGQNWGSGQSDRARDALIKACGFCLLYGFAVAGLLLVFSEPLAQLFTGSDRATTAIGNYLAIAGWGFGAFGVLVVVNGAFNAIDKAPIALAQSLARVFFMMVPFAVLAMPMLGAKAIYGAELAANIGGALVASFLAWRLMR